MTFPAIDDDRLPGLKLASNSESLSDAIDAALCEASHGFWRCEQITIRRFRYRQGKRAILQLMLKLAGPEGAPVTYPGALWFFAGGKAKARSKTGTGPTRRMLPHTLFEPVSAAILTLFPYDRRVPEIAEFLADPASHTQGLLGRRSTKPPQLSRYRPGLGATFRWHADDLCGFVKVFNDRSASEKFAELNDLAQRCIGLDVQTPVPLGFSEDLCAVALKQARGVPLSDILRDGSADEIGQAIESVLKGLTALNGLDVRPVRSRTASDLLRRASATAALIATIDPELGGKANECAGALRESLPCLRLMPTHMDMKIEHVLINDRRACLLDLDSLALSDPLYDPAMLLARIELAALTGEVPHRACEAAYTVLLRTIGPGTRRNDFCWLLGIARLQTVRFLMQNIRPHWRDLSSHLLVAAFQPQPVSPPNGVAP